MFYSGILVLSKPGEYDTALKNVRNRGIEVYHEDRGQSRFVAVLEGKTLKDETDEFKKILELPGVMDVSLVVSQEDTEEAV